MNDRQSVIVVFYLILAKKYIRDLYTTRRTCKKVVILTLRHNTAGLIIREKYDKALILQLRNSGQNIMQNNITIFITKLIDIQI